MILVKVLMETKAVSVVSDEDQQPSNIALSNSGDITRQDQMQGSEHSSVPLDKYHISIRTAHKNR